MMATMIRTAAEPGIVEPETQYDLETSELQVPAEDYYYLDQITDSTDRFDDTSNAWDWGADRAPCNAVRSRETLTGTGLTNMGTQSTEPGIVEAETQYDLETSELQVPAEDYYYLNQITDSTDRFDDTSNAWDWGAYRAPCNAVRSRETLTGTGLTNMGTQSTEFVDTERPMRVNDVMTLLTHVATVTGMKAAYKNSRRGATLAGGGAVLGGMLCGPPGIFLGAAVCGLIGCLTSEDYKPVPQVLMELSAAEKQKLCAEAMDVVKNLHWTDAAQLIRLVMSNSTIRDQVFRVLKNFVTKVLKAKVKYD